MSGESVRPRRSRKSIAFQPNASGASKDNSTAAPEASTKSTRKTRSKSLGPGGLDALNAEENKKDILKSGNGNGRRASSLAPVHQVKSILMPTLPLSPLKEIPAHRPRTQLRGAPSQSASRTTVNYQPPSSIFQPPPPPSNQTTATIPLRTEEEQQKRAEILAARALRRQSLGNRRVSFAPEATLHTWDVSESYRGDGDSTPGSSAGGSSRASTPASNRRSSSGSTAEFQATPTPTSAEPPSTPQDDEPPETPLGEKNRRVSVAETPPMNFNNPDDEFMSSSPFSSPTGDEAAFVEDEDSHSDSSDSMDEDAGDRTFVSAAGETTMGDMTLAKMDMDVEDEATRQPIFKKPMQWRFEGGLPSSPPVQKSEDVMPATEQEDDDEGEQTMDVTKAIGGLLSTSNQARPSLTFSPKTPQKLDDDSEATMDITRPVGGLLRSQPAVPQPQHQDESDDMMDITRPLGGILSAAGKEKQDIQPTNEGEEMDMTMDMDITRPIGGILSNMASKLRKSIGFAMPQRQQQPEADEMDMDITRPIGGIVSTKSPSPIPNDASEVDLNEDMTMEFTSVLGGIISQAPSRSGRRRSSLGTGRRGGLLMSGDSWAKDQAEKQSLMDKQLEDGMDMDMTVALGGILSAAAVKDAEEEMDHKPAVAYPTLKEDVKASEPVAYPALPEANENDGEDQEMDESFSMDMTVNLGGILQNHPTVTETVSSQEKPTSASVPVSVPKPTTPEASNEDTPAQLDSPPPLDKRNTRRSSGAASTITTQRVTRGAHRKSLELQHKDSTSQPSPRTVSTPKQTPVKTATSVKATPTKKRSSPQTSTKKESSPHAQPTPQAKVTSPRSGDVTRQENATTQAKVATPQAKPASPQKPATPQPVASSEKGSPVASTVRKSKSPAKSSSNPSTPRRVNSTPKRSRFEMTTSSDQPRTPLKGVGFDKPGLGSPAISQKLSRRKSLGEDTMAFSPVALPSALILACRMDAQKREREEREERLRREEEEKTMDLKSRIQLLTPRKQDGRKSLVLGSLFPGKRPLESTPESARKRRKSANGTSNVVEEVEEAKEAEMEGLEPTKGSTPNKMILAPLPGSSKKNTPQKTTPQKTVVAAAPQTSDMPNPHQQVRFAVSFGDDEEVEDPTDDDEIDNISLQQFLNIIGISFLELTASKHRDTSFKPINKRLSVSMDDEEASLADSLKAAACTAPMLEMFQYLCRDLERHINEGRDMIAEIEEIAESENPALFQEYIQAPADLKALMDNQFKNIKTYSRLTAKRDWYQWRMKNVDSVKDGLQRNLDGLQADERFVEEQKAALDPLLPEIKKSWEKARYQLRKLEDMKQRIDMDDQDELMDARSRLSDILNKIEMTQAQIQQKRQQTDKMDEEIKTKETKEAQLIVSIEEAERVKEMNRGWSENEVRTWKTRCEELEKSSGWSISKALADGRLEMMFMRQVKLLLDPKGQVAPTVEYVCPAGQKLSDCKPLPAVESEFFITGLNSILSQERHPKTILQKISSYWQVALEIVGNIRRLRTHHYTEVETADDGNLHVRATILVQELRSKMEVSFVVAKESLLSQGTGVRVVYGAIPQQAVQDALMRWTGEWREGVSEVVEKCLEGRRRGGVVVSVKG
ncbi:Spc7-domain-containing protein [Wilcoxina mikolae CBS 423.85]|nr:Spc7-domain-containing protein [Wilcoxina mikolae CBS 423.85]